MNLSRSWLSGERNTRSLLRDDRGVIMIAGVFFTLLVIGLIWFIFGIGNAIAYRENLQNAADASAFAAAVYDARGMNLLAMINIVMGITLATLIVAKFIQIPIVLSDLKTCNNSIKLTEHICETPIIDVGCPAAILVTIGICSAKCSNIDSWKSKLSKWDTGVHDVLKVLHDGEVGLAVVWPWIAAGKSGNVQFYYQDGTNLKNGVSVTSSFAYSQIPWNLDSTASIGSLISGNPSSNKTTPKGPVRYGLPVTSDSYKDLCYAAFDDITTLGGIASPNVLSQYLAQGLDLFHQWFCDDDSGSQAGNDVASAIIEEGLPLAAGAQAMGFCVIYDAATGGLEKALGKGGGGFGKYSSAFSPLPMSTTPPGVKSDDTTYSTMMLFPDATMGLDYFGVWSTAIGDYDDTWSTQKIVIAGQQATSGSKTVSTTPNDVYVGVAKSEFYYDPRSGDSKDSETTMTIKNQLTPTNVMWNMRWRARLRRYHYFPGADGLGDAVIDLMNQGFTAIASQAVQDLLAGKNPLTELTNSEVSVKKLPSGGAPNIYH